MERGGRGVAPPLGGQPRRVVNVRRGRYRVCLVLKPSSKGVGRSFRLGRLLDVRICTQNIAEKRVAFYLLPKRVGRVIAAGPGPANSAAIGPRLCSKAMVNLRGR